MNFECGFLGNPMEGVEHLTLTNLLPCGLGKKKKSKQNEKKKINSNNKKKKLVRTLRLRILMYF